MEEVLDGCKRTYNPEKPVVCIDEIPKQPIHEKRREFTDSKDVVHYDTEYVRNGTTNVFMAVEPVAGKRFPPVQLAEALPPLAFKIRYMVAEGH